MVHVRKVDALRRPSNGSISTEKTVAGKEKLYMAGMRSSRR
jgi:hypothetical protein